MFSSSRPLAVPLLHLRRTLLSSDGPPTVVRLMVCRVTRRLALESSTPSASSSSNNRRTAIPTLLTSRTLQPEELLNTTHTVPPVGRFLLRLRATAVAATWSGRDQSRSRMEGTRLPLVALTLDVG